MTDKTQSPHNNPISHKDAIDAEVIEATVEDKSTPPDHEAENKPAKTGILWLFTLLNLILIIVLCAGAYWYYMQIDNDESSQQTALSALSEQFNEQVQNIQTNVSEVKRNSQVLETQINSTTGAAQQSIKAMQQEIEDNANANKALSKRLAEMSGRRPSDWLLAEADYLVNMAARKLYIENDIRTSMTLLKEADARLKDLNDPSLFSVRALIAADIQTLNQVNTVSTSSIALTLAGMLPKVSELPLDKLQLPEDLGQDDQALSEDVSDWRTNLALTWKAIVGDLISIDHVDEPLEPYLAERQQWLIEQQLKHALNQAQTSALNEQVDVYRLSTQQAISLINEHYQLNNPQVKQVLVTLQELQGIDFSKNYPNTLASQASLKDIIEQRIKGLFNNAPDTEQEALGNSL